MLEAAAELSLNPVDISVELRILRAWRLRRKDAIATRALSSGQKAMTGGGELSGGRRL